MKRLISIFVAIILAGCAMAQEYYYYDFSAECESGQTLYYRVTSKTEPYTVEVVPLIENGNPDIPYTPDHIWDFFNTCYQGDLKIPSSVTYNGKTYSVTRIDNEAFYGCEELTSVTIPNSVTSIGNYSWL